MNTKLKILFTNDADSATLTGGTYVASLPVTNLQIATRASLARTTGIGYNHILGDFPAVKTIEMLALLRTNVLKTGSVMDWQLKLYSAVAQGGSVLYDSGVSFGGNFSGADWFVAWCTPTANVRSFDFKYQSTLNSDGYLQAARLMMGTTFTPQVNMTYDRNPPKCYWQDDSTQEPTDGGTLRTDPLEPYRIWEISLEHMAEVDRAALMAAARACGKRGDVFISLFPQSDVAALEVDNCGWAKIIQMPQLTTDRYDNWTGSLILRET